MPLQGPVPTVVQDLRCAPHWPRQPMTTSKNWMPGVASNWGMGVTDHQQPQVKGVNGMEDWAAKARAWATAKAAQDAAFAQAQAQYQQQQVQAQAQAQVQQGQQQEHAAGYYGNDWQQQQQQHQGQGPVQAQGHGGFPSRHGEQQVRPAYGGHDVPPPSYSQDWEAWNSRPWQDVPPPSHPHVHPLPHSHSQVPASDQQQQQAQQQQQQAFHDYPPPHQAPQSQSLPQQPVAAPGYNHDVHMDFSQDSSSYPQEPPATAYDMDTSSNFAQDGPPSNYVQDSASTSYKQPTAGLVPVSSNYSQDASSSFGQESAAAVPPGTELQDHQQHPAMPPAPVLPQHQQLVPSPTQSQPLAHSQQSQQAPQPQPIPVQQQSQQQQQFPYPYPPPMPSYELQPHQQFEFQQPGHPEYAHQPPPQFMPPVPSVGIEGPEMGYGAPSSMQGWPPLAPGMSFPPAVGVNMPGGPGGPQFEHLHHHQQPHGLQPPHVFTRPPGPNFRPPGPPLAASFGFGPNSSISSIPGVGMAPMFPGDVNGNSAAMDRPKKAAVPSWLREELIKKKAAAVSGNSVTLSTPEEVLGNGIAGVPVANRKLDHAKSDSSGASDAEEDEDEDEAEAARTAAINHEIKRILTEILLKVTQDIFDEIAQEVVDEDDGGISEVAGVGSKVSEITGEATAQSSSPPSPPAVPAAVTAPVRVIVAHSKPAQPSSEDDTGSLSSGAPTGNLLGLATYASDDEDGERSSLPPAVTLSRRSGLETNGEVKEKNVRKKGDPNGKSAEHARGSESKERSSSKTARLEGSTKASKVDVMPDSKRMKRSIDENNDGPSPRRPRLSHGVERDAEGGAAVSKEEDVSQQNHVADPGPEQQQALLKETRGGMSEPVNTGKHDVGIKTRYRSRSDQISDAKDHDASQSKHEAKRETKSKENSNRDAERKVAVQVQDANHKDRLLEDVDTLRKDHEHTDRREASRNHETMHSRKRDGHRDQDKSSSKHSEKSLERDRKADHGVEIDRSKERSKGQGLRSEREKRRSDKETDSKSRDRQRDGRERKESRDSREGRRRKRRSSSTGSRGRSRSTNY